MTRKERRNAPLRQYLVELISQARFGNSHHVSLAPIDTCVWTLSAFHVSSTDFTAILGRFIAAYFIRFQRVGWFSSVLAFNGYEPVSNRRR